MKRIIFFVVIGISLVFSSCEKEIDTNADLVEIEVSSQGGDFVVEYTKYGQKLTIKMESGYTYTDSYLFGDDKNINIKAYADETFPASTILTIAIYYEGKLIKETMSNSSVYLIVSRDDL